MNWKETLKYIAYDPELNPKLINTFSLMECIGVRKITKSFSQESYDMDILQHLSEQIQHTRVLKKFALQLSNQELNTYSDWHLLSGKQATTYFQSLDRGIQIALKRPDVWINYLYATMLIGSRTCDVYKLYEEHMAAQGHPGYFQSIIVDSEWHAKRAYQLLEDCTPSTYSTMALDLELKKVEKEAFYKWMKALAACVMKNSDSSEILVKAS